MTMTDKIFKLSAPYQNPYQGKSYRVVFVCSAGLLRSATAANMYAKRGYNTRSCGSSEYALIPLSVNLLAWADLLFFVNKENYEESKAKFGDTSMWKDLENRNAIFVLDIPDQFAYNDPELCACIDDQVQLEKKTVKDRETARHTGVF